MIRFSVNLNKIALIRNARDPQGQPDLGEMVRICLDNGANGITLHPRPDGRHARFHDLQLMRELLLPTTAELNMEGNPFSKEEDNYPGFMAMARACVPDQCTLVPDHRNQLTSDHGWMPDTSRAPLTEVVEELQSLGCRVSLFIDPKAHSIALATDIGANAVELFTADWAQNHQQMMEHSEDGESSHKSFRNYVETAKQAVAAGLAVHAGHDLNLQNLAPIIGLPGLAEVSIGQALITDALRMGLAEAVRMYAEIVQQGGRQDQLAFDEFS